MPLAGRRQPVQGTLSASLSTKAAMALWLCQGQDVCPAWAPCLLLFAHFSHFLLLRWLGLPQSIHLPLALVSQTSLQRLLKEDPWPLSYEEGQRVQADRVSGCFILLSERSPRGCPRTGA